MKNLPKPDWHAIQAALLIELGWTHFGGLVTAGSELLTEIELVPTHATATKRVLGRDLCFQLSTRTPDLVLEFGPRSKARSRGKKTFLRQI